MLGGNADLVAPETPNARTEVKTPSVLPEEKSIYYAKRIQLFEEFFRREIGKVEEAKAAGDTLKVTLPDGTIKEGVKGVTTPMDIAETVSKSLAKKSLVAKVDGAEWDMTRPLETDCRLQLFGFDTPEGKEAFWHSSSHVLGQALELQYGVDLTVGPPIEEGFYYDCYMGDRTLHPEDLEVLEGKIDEAVKSKYPFQRIVVSRQEALGMFQENKFKVGSTFSWSFLWTRLLDRDLEGAGAGGDD